MHFMDLRSDDVLLGIMPRRNALSPFLPEHVSPYSIHWWFARIFIFKLWKSPSSHYPLTPPPPPPPPPLNPFPNKPWFLCVCCTSPLRTLREKKKLLITSNFSFSLSVSTELDNCLPFSSNLELSSGNAFSLEGSKNLLFGKGLKLARRQKPFRHFAMVDIVLLIIL